MEKVYMAKLAVFMLVPKKLIMHCPLSARGDESLAGVVVLKPALQDTDPSDRRTPRSRAEMVSILAARYDNFWTNRVVLR